MQVFHVQIFFDDQKLGKTTIKEIEKELRETFCDPDYPEDLRIVDVS